MPITIIVIIFLMFAYGTWAFHICFQCFFQYKCERFYDMNCLCFTGLFVGALIRYAATKTTTTHLTVYPNNTMPTYNNSLPPDTLWLNVIEHFGFFPPSIPPPLSPLSFCILFCNNRAFYRLKCRKSLEDITKNSFHLSDAIFICLYWLCPVSSGLHSVAHICLYHISLNLHVRFLLIFPFLTLYMLGHSFIHLSIVR